MTSTATIVPHAGKPLSVLSAAVGSAARVRAVDAWTGAGRRVVVGGVVAGFACVEVARVR
jgi:hypothetical protein